MSREGVTRSREGRRRHVAGERRGRAPDLRGGRAPGCRCRTRAEEYEELIEVGEQVISVGTAGGTGRKSGLPVVLDQAARWTIRDGRFVRVVWCPNRAGALASAELSE